MRRFQGTPAFAKNNPVHLFLHGPSPFHAYSISYSCRNNTLKGSYVFVSTLHDFFVSAESKNRSLRHQQDQEGVCIIVLWEVAGNNNKTCNSILPTVSVCVPGCVHVEGIVFSGYTVPVVVFGKRLGQSSESSHIWQTLCSL